MKTSLRFVSRIASLFALLAVLAAGLTITHSTAASAADNTAGCGGESQKPCPITSKASFIAKAQTKCPSGTFFDLSTAACWSCPRGTHRTVLPISSSKACERRPSTSFAKADKERKVKIGKKGCKKGEFWDKKGGTWGACWECPKDYKRGVHPVDSSKACVKVSGLKHYKASRNSKFVPCPKGFFDPRAGGQCWSCPGGYFRGVTKVNSKDACFIKPASVCDPGNILVYNKCLKKGECGKKGQRPCLIIERIPSCNSGLAEDFIANKCVSTPVALCLAVVRMANGVKGAGDAIKKLISNTPGLKSAFNNRKKEQNSGESDTKKKKKTIFDKLFADAKGASKEILAVKAVADKAMKDVNKLRKALLREKFCTMTAADGKKLLADLDLKPANIFKKASIFDGLGNPFIKSAHAAKPKNFYMSYAASIAGGVGLGGAFELSLVTDYDKHVGSFVSIGPAAVSNATIGASFNVGFYWRSHISDFAGWGFGMGVAGGPPAPPIGVGLDFYIPKGWGRLEGIGFNVGAGVGYFPADGNFSASYAWRMW